VPPFSTASTLRRSGLPLYVRFVTVPFPAVLCCKLLPLGLHLERLPFCSTRLRTAAYFLYRLPGRRTTAEHPAAPLYAIPVPYGFRFALSYTETLHYSVFLAVFFFSVPCLRLAFADRLAFICSCVDFLFLPPRAVEAAGHHTTHRGLRHGEDATLLVMIASSALFFSAVAFYHSALYFVARAFTTTGGADFQGGRCTPHTHHTAHTAWRFCSHRVGGDLPDVFVLCRRFVIISPSVFLFFLLLNGLGLQLTFCRCLRSGSVSGHSCHLYYLAFRLAGRAKARAARNTLGRLPARLYAAIRSLLQRAAQAWFGSADIMPFGLDAVWRVSAISIPPCAWRYLVSRRRALAPAHRIDWT